MESPEDILKGALLLERRGKALYEASAAGTAHPGVRELFLTLAQEEGRHIEVLAQAFASLARTGKFAPGALGEVPPVAERVLGAVRTEVEAASYEAAALYAAMALEERAVAYYTEAEAKSSGEARRLYGWLARWERSHLDLLTALDQDLKQRIWFDQKFWPF